jgi:hypothetical protein
LTAGSNPASIPGSIASRSAASGASGASLNGNLDYHGGPVLHSTAPYLVFWIPTGESIPGGTQALLARYFTDVAADNGTSSNVYGSIASSSIRRASPTTSRPSAQTRSSSIPIPSRPAT